MKYDYTVFIGRFQPFHYGHARVIEQALEQSDKVIILIGSSGGARSWRNPFTFYERSKVIYDWATKEKGYTESQFFILPLMDHVYNNQRWITDVQEIVTKAIDRDNHAHKMGWTDVPPKISLIGHSKDHTSYYLSMFPQWDTIDVPPVTDRHLVNSTEIRNAYFSLFAMEAAYFTTGDASKFLPKATLSFLESFKTQGTDYETLCEENRYLIKYREDHRYARDVPYRPTHTTVDACVIQSGHILLIRRAANPGKGLLAMPGGFIDEFEKLEDGMLRELREETKLKVPAPVLRGNIQRREIYDDPHRSGRGRIFSHTFLIVLPPDPKGLPKVKGSSDASSAFWMPLSEIKAADFFEDHYFIITHITGDL